MCTCCWVGQYVRVLLGRPVYEVATALSVSSLSSDFRSPSTYISPPPHRLCSHLIVSPLGILSALPHLLRFLRLILTQLPSHTIPPLPSPPIPSSPVPSPPGVPMPVGKHAKATSLPLECPLHSAARHPPPLATPLIRLLVAADADTNRADQFRQTPLHVAAAWVPPEHSPAGHSPAGLPPAGLAGESGYGDAMAVLELMRCGAAPQARDSTGRTPLMLASSGAIRSALSEDE